MELPINRHIGDDRKTIVPAENNDPLPTVSVYRAQADALEIEAGAKRRLADEYDAAQDRGEITKAGNQPILPGENNCAPASVTDLGLTHKEIHEARLVRDAEVADPGVVP